MLGQRRVYSKLHPFNGHSHFCVLRYELCSRVAFWTMLADIPVGWRCGDVHMCRTDTVHLRRRFSVFELILAIFAAFHYLWTSLRVKAFPGCSIKHASCSLTLCFCFVFLLFIFFFFFRLVRGCPKVQYNSVHQNGSSVRFY